MILYLHSEIYKKDNIEQSKNAYKDFANIEIKQELTYWKVIFTECKYSGEQTAKAFENYLIGLENL